MTLPSAKPQSGVDQSEKEFPARHFQGARCYQSGVAGEWHVVMITIEGPLRQARRCRKRMQFDIANVAHQMRKHGSVRRPEGRVDQDGHSFSMPDRAAAYAS